MERLRDTARGLLAGVAVAAASAGGGCTDVGVPPDRLGVLDAPPPPGEALPATTTGAAIAGFVPTRTGEPPRAGHATFATVVGGTPPPERDAPDGIWWTDEAARPLAGSEGGARWSIERSVREAGQRVGEGRVVSERTLVVGADGAVAVRRIVDAEKNREFVFDPPLTVLPARVEAGAVLNSESSLRALEAGTGDTLGEGSARSETRVIGQSAVELFNGETVSAWEIETTLRLAIRGVTVRRSARRWYAPGWALVAAEERTETRLLIVTIPARSVGLRRAETGAVRSAPPDPPR
jgi:hypothetical protein